MLYNNVLDASVQKHVAHCYVALQCCMLLECFNLFG